MPSRLEDERVSSHRQDSDGVAILRDFVVNNPSLEFVVYQFMDFSGIVRCHITTVSRALSIAANPEDGLSFPANMSQAGGVDDHFDPKLARRGKDVAVPDWSSIFLYHHAPHRAVVNCFVNEEEAGYSRCPRTMLKRLVNDAGASESLATKFLIGFEIEFYIIESLDAEAPMKTPITHFGVASTRDPNFIIVEDAVRVIEKAGIKVWKFHAEGGHGCYEIAVAPMPPLQAVDALLYAREAIRAVAEAKGLRATMHPKPFEKAPPCGLHMHISISTPDGKPQPEEIADSFLAGLLQSTPALCALAMPNYDSYSRTMLGVNRQWVMWGEENRLAAIRQIGPAHWEIRKVDSMSNIYLVLVSMLGVGLAAVKRQEILNMKPLLTFDLTGNLPDEDERAELGVTTLLPSSLKEALEHLRDDAHVRDAITQPVLESYLYVKKTEEGRFAKMTRLERVQACLKNF